MTFSRNEKLKDLRDVEVISESRNYRGHVWYILRESTSSQLVASVLNLHYRDSLSAFKVHKVVKCSTTSRGDKKPEGG
jgi:hypothetical protein